MKYRTEGNWVNTKSQIQRARYKQYLRNYYNALVESEQRGRRVRPAPESVEQFLAQLSTLVDRKTASPAAIGSAIPKLERKRA